MDPTTTFPWLSLLVFLPALGAIALMLVPSDQPRVARGLALTWSLGVFLLSLGLLHGFEPGAAFQLTERHDWLPSLGASYSVGVDGISLFLVLLTTLLVPISILSTFSAVTDRVREFHIAFLVLETGMIGALVSLDMLLFYVFWEVMLVPMYLLIGIWGGDHRLAAAIKFVVYTLVGSLLMLTALLYLYLQTPGDHSFDLTAMQAAGAALPLDIQLWLFAGFALSFAIKVPFFPFHTWLPDAHTEAPTAGSVILAGVLLKMGTYGFIRFALPFFPAAVQQATPLLMVLAVVGIVYGALVAMIQTDVKRLVAYSSVSHLGFVMLGLLAATPEAVTGGVYQMLNHGISTGGLFLAVGVLYERRHTRLIKEFGGLASRIPRFSALFVIICLSSLGLPGLNGFVGEFLILLGTFKAAVPGAQIAAGVAATGVILAAVYLLWTVLRVLFGPLDNPKNAKLADLTSREWLVFAPIIALIFVMGLFPGWFLERIEPSVDRFLGGGPAVAAQVVEPKPAPKKRSKRVKRLKRGKRSKDQRVLNAKEMLRKLPQIDFRNALKHRGRE